MKKVMKLIKKINKKACEISFGFESEDDFKNNKMSISMDEIKKEIWIKLYDDYSGYLYSNHERIGHFNSKKHLKKILKKILKTKKID